MLVLTLRRGIDVLYLYWDGQNFELVFTSEATFELDKPITLMYKEPRNIANIVEKLSERWGIGVSDKKRKGLRKGNVERREY